VLYDFSMNHELARERRKLIADYVAEGRSHRDAAKKFNVCPALVSNACIEHGILSQIRAKNITLEIIADLQNANLSRSQIASKRKVTVSAVRAVLKRAKKAGLKIPPRS